MAVLLFSMEHCGVLYGVCWWLQVVLVVASVLACQPTRGRVR